MDCVIPPLCRDLGGSVSLDMLPRRVTDMTRRSVEVLGLNNPMTFARVGTVAEHAIGKVKAAIPAEARQTVTAAMREIGSHVKTIVEATGLKDPKRQAAFIAGLKEYSAEFLRALGLNNREKITEVAALTHNPVTAKMLELGIKMAAGVATGAEKGTYISSILAQLSQIPFLFSNFMRPAAAAMSKAI